MTEQLLIAILYSRGLIQNIKIEYVKQSRPRGDDDVFCGTCGRVSSPPYFDVSPIVFDVLKFLTQI